MAIEAPESGPRRAVYSVRNAAVPQPPCPMCGAGHQPAETRCPACGEELEPPSTPRWEEPGDDKTGRAGRSVILGLFGVFYYPVVSQLMLLMERHLAWLHWPVVLLLCGVICFLVPFLSVLAVAFGRQFRMRYHAVASGCSGCPFGSSMF
jgi:hypothetical protein